MSTSTMHQIIRIKLNLLRNMKSNNRPLWCFKRYKSSIMVSGLKVDITDDLHYEADIPGFTYCDFDRYGNLALWNVCKYTELGRAFQGKQPIAPVRRGNIVDVVSGQIWKINKQLYERAALSYPMKYVDSPGYKGSTSIISLVQICERDTGIPLVHCERQLVFIDEITRKKVPIPKHVLERNNSERPTKFIINTTPQPRDAHIFHLKARISDYDQSQHVNACSFVKWIMDAAAEIATEGKFRNFNNDFNYCAQELQIFYLSECFANDHILVSIWEDCNNKKLGFHIEKRDNRGLTSAAKGTVQFFDEKFESISYSCDVPFN